MQRVIATKKDNPNKRYEWNDTHDITLQEFKDKPKLKDDYTFSELEEHPDVAKINILKGHLQKIDDPDPEVSHHSIKVLIRHILKDLMED